MRQAIRINRVIIYLTLGLIIIIFRESLVNYLSYIVGIPMLVLAFEGLLYEIFTKSFLRKSNYLGLEILRFILSIIIIALNNNMQLICIIWGILVIVTSTRVLNKSIYRFAINRNRFFSIFDLVESTIQIVFAILLIIHPTVGHVNFHLVLLGIEMLLEALRVGLGIFIHAKMPNVKIIINED